MSNEEWYGSPNVAYNTIPSQRRGCSLPGLFFFFLLATIIGVIGLFVFFLAGEYKSWKTNTFTELDKSHYVQLNKVTAVENEEINKKIENYSESSEVVDTIEFTPREVAILLGGAVSESLPEWIRLTHVYVEPHSGLWRVYFKSQVGGLSLPWISVRLIKDDIEGAELFVSHVGIGDYDIEDIGLGFVADNVNDGYRDALLLINRSKITDREFENIELNSDMLIIKGRALE